MTKAKKELGPCQVRSRTDRPCLRPAAVKIQGIPFCEPCAREQEVYFAIGELTEESQGLRQESLAETLNRIRWERTGRNAAGFAAAKLGRPRAAVGNPW